MTTVAVAGGFAKTQKRAAVSLAASGVVVAAVAGKRLKVYTYSLQSRNAITATASALNVTNNAGTVIAKKALSDDGVTYTEAKMVTGP